MAKKAVQLRTPAGVWQPVYDDLQVLNAVGQIAYHLAPDDPTSLSQPAFNRAKETAATELGLPATPPTASAIYQRLNRAAPGRLTWTQILEIACDPERSGRQALAAAQRQDEQPELSHRHVFFALRMAANHLKLPTVNRAQYGRSRLELIDRDSTGQLEARLPTLGQIERVARGEWNRKHSRSKQQPSDRDVWGTACEIAGMPKPKPPPPPPPSTGRGYRGRRGEPKERMLNIWADANPNEFPSQRILLEFTRKLGLKLDGSREGSWSETLDRVRQDRAARGLSTPKDPPRRGGQGVKGVQYNLPKEPVEPSTPEPGSGGRSRESLIDALRQYDRSLKPGKRGSRDHYLQVRKKDWPAPNAFDRFEGFEALLKEAQQLNLEARAATVQALGS